MMVHELAGNPSIFIICICEDKAPCMEVGRWQILGKEGKPNYNPVFLIQSMRILQKKSSQKKE